MKRILIVIFLMGNIHLFAQSCIPNPAMVSIEIGRGIQQNNIAEIKKHVATRADIQAFFDAMKIASGETESDTPDDADKELESETLNSLDTLMARIQRLGIDLNKAIVSNLTRKISSEKGMPEGLLMAEGVIKFSLPDSVIKVQYSFFFCKSEWKMVEIENSFSIYDGKHKFLGSMRETYMDENEQSNTPTKKDTLMEGPETNAKMPASSAPKKSAKKASPAKKRPAQKPKR